MKVTRLGNTDPASTITGILGSSGGLGPSGQVPTSNGSNSVAWGSNVATFWANGSNQLIGPAINLASGSNITFTIDSGPGGSSPSNTLRIHSTASGSGSASLTVADEGTPLATSATTLDFVGAGVTASGTGATKTITIPGGGGATINQGPLRPGTPLDDFDSALSGWTAEQRQGTFVIGDAHAQAIDGSHLVIGFDNSRGFLRRAVSANNDLELHAGGLSWSGAPSSTAFMNGIGILDTSGDGVAILQYNDNEAYLANIVGWAYSSAYATIGTPDLGHTYGGASGIGKSPIWMKLTRVTNTWDGYISVDGIHWNHHASTTGSKTITAAYIVIGNFLSQTTLRMVCDWIHEV